ncbi:MAG TPA: hypothetical protein VHT52_15575 [Stellaceae bacterium]|nr:hypothetical protein [Stellaceae bacterium]
MPLQSPRHETLGAGNLERGGNARCVIRVSGETTSTLRAEEQVVCVPV